MVQEPWKKNLLLIALGILCYVAVGGLLYYLNNSTQKFEKLVIYGVPEPLVKDTPELTQHPLPLDNVEIKDFDTSTRSMSNPIKGRGSENTDSTEASGKLTSMPGSPSRQR